MGRLRLIILFTFAALGGCSMPAIQLAPGETANIAARISPGNLQLLELAAEPDGKQPTEVSILSGNNIILPPVYLDPAHLRRTEKGKVIAPLYWSPHWPWTAGSKLEVVNYGPGNLKLNSLKVFKGGADKLSARARELSPYTRKWTDFQAMLNETKPTGDIVSSALEQIESLGAWDAQQRRRNVLAGMSGKPLPVRLDQSLIADVEFHAAQIEPGLGVVAVTRPDPTSWRPLGPGWYPPTNDSKWVHLSKSRPMPRGFKVDQPHLAIALFMGGYAPQVAAGASSPVMTNATVVANLYRIDSLDPVKTVKLEGLTSHGRWLEIKFDELQQPGEYVIELLALEGYPAWLAWNRESVPVPGSEWTSVVETLLVHEAPADARFDTAIPVGALVSGLAQSVQHIHGGSKDGEPYHPELRDNEMRFEADLLPGETEIFLLINYKEPR